jgi:hypothetical protein
MIEQFFLPIHYDLKNIEVLKIINLIKKIL